MIIDGTGVEIIPGERGVHCPGNGNKKDSQGKPIECCCEECDYYMCCSESHQKEECESCFDEYCPHAQKNLSKGEKRFHT